MRAEWKDMGAWVDAVGRSSRLLLGLERGEQVGAPTLRTIEELLGWRPGYANVILEDPNADLSPEVGRPLRRLYAPPDDARPLDEFTTDELLAELRLRFAEMAVELHTPERPTMTERQDGNDRVLEAMSPKRRREGDDRRE
jgi:hypothetical protein